MPGASLHMQDHVNGSHQDKNWHNFFNYYDIKPKGGQDMKALTPAMIRILKDCHQRELDQQDPCGGLSHTQSAKGLLNRGLLQATPYTNINTGSKYLAFLITDQGKTYLQNLL